MIKWVYISHQGAEVYRDIPGVYLVTVGNSVQNFRKSVWLSGQSFSLC